jgi:hypothetical protein
MFKDWTWQKWLGKFVAIAVGVGELVIKELGIANIPWWPIVATGVVALVQWIVALFPPKQPAV